MALWQGNVSDLALMLDAMCGHEDADPLSMPAPPDSFLDAASARQLPDTIAYSVDLGITPVDLEVRRVFQDAINKIAGSGVNMVEVHPDFHGLNGHIPYASRPHFFLRIRCFA